MTRAALRAAGLAIACLAAIAAKKAVQPMEWKGAHCSSKESTAVVAHDPAEWKALWAKIGKPAPEADLDANVAVGVFAGERPTGGYSIVWEPPFDRDGKTVVRYRVDKPKGIVTQAFTSPYAVRLFAKTGKPVVAEAAP